MNLSIVYSYLLVCFSTRGLSVPTLALEDGMKPELGHWFGLILDPLAILNQPLFCESTQQTRLSFLLRGQCGSSGAIDRYRSWELLYEISFQMWVLGHVVWKVIVQGHFKCKKTDVGFSRQYYKRTLGTFSSGKMLLFTFASQSWVCSDTARPLATLCLCPFKWFSIPGGPGSAVMDRTRIYRKELVSAVSALSPQHEAKWWFPELLYWCSIWRLLSRCSFM